MKKYFSLNRGEDLNLGGGQVSDLTWDNCPGMSDFHVAYSIALTLSGCHSLLRLL